MSGAGRRGTGGSSGSWCSTSCCRRRAPGGKRRRGARRKRVSFCAQRVGALLRRGSGALRARVTVLGSAERCAEAPRLRAPNWPSSEDPVWAEARAAPRLSAGKPLRSEAVARGAGTLACSLKHNSGLVALKALPVGLQPCRSSARMNCAVKAIGSYRGEIFKLKGSVIRFQVVRS